MSRYVDPVAKAEREARIMRRYRKLVVGLAFVAFLGQFEGMYFAGVALFLLPYFLLWYSNTALIYTLAAFPLVRRYARDGTVFVRDFLAIAAVAVLPVRSVRSRGASESERPRVASIQCFGQSQRLCAGDRDDAAFIQDSFGRRPAAEQPETGRRFFPT